MFKKMLLSLLLLFLERILQWRRWTHLIECLGLYLFKWNHTWNIFKTIVWVICLFYHLWVQLAAFVTHHHNIKWGRVVILQITPTTHYTFFWWMSSYLFATSTTLATFWTLLILQSNWYRVFVLYHFCSSSLSCNLLWEILIFVRAFLLRLTLLFKINLLILLKLLQKRRHLFFFCILIGMDFAVAVFLIVIHAIRNWRYHEWVIDNSLSFKRSL